MFIRLGDVVRMVMVVVMVMVKRMVLMIVMG